MGTDAAIPARVPIHAVLPLLAGSVAALGLAPFGLPLVTVAVLAGFTWHVSTRAQAPGAAALAGFTLGLGYFVVALHWIVQPFMVDAARHGWMAPFALAGLAAGMALFWAAGLWGAARLAGRAGPLVIVLGLGLAEMIRSGFLGGFPWALIGSVWVDSPARAAAAWAGVHGLSLLTLGLAAGLAAMVRRSAAGGVIAALCAALLVGSALTAHQPQPPGPDALRVRVIQANAAQHLKWRPDMIPVFWERRLQLTRASAGRPPDVVVWPEVALPYLAGTNAEADRMIAEAARGAIVLAGAQRRTDEGALFNSLVAIDPEGALAGLYDKHHLVPFGEYFPGGALAARLGLAGLATDALGAFTPGPGPRVLDLGPLGTVAPLICYEAIFPRHARAARPRPDWIVQVTNDAWFGTFAGPQQHLDLARLRAVEQGLPLVRAANTGISAVIGPDGALLGQIALDTAGHLDVDLPAALPPTPYARLGAVPVWVALGALAGLLLLRRRRMAAA